MGLAVSEPRVPEAVVSATKAIRTPDLLREIQRRSVQDVETSPAMPLIQIARVADEAPRWWSASRDQYLRKFFPTEPYLCGALYSVIARNAAYKLEFEGPEAGVKKAKKLMASCNFFKGWQNFALLTSLDQLSQDNAGFFEIIRPTRVKILGGFEGQLERYNGATLKATKMMVKSKETGEEDLGWVAQTPYPREWVSLEGIDYKRLDNPMDLPLSLAHLDAACCRRTGDPEKPVTYTDNKNKEHTLQWWQVATLDDMPSADRSHHGVGYSAVTRALRLSQTLRSIQIYKQEKVDGRFAGTVWVTNIAADIISDAIAGAMENAASRNLSKYMPPVVAGTMDPSAIPTVAEIKLASLPDGYNEEEMLRWYIAGLALDFGVDYGFFAPLPGNKLGTSQQAEVAERQSRGKASRLYMSQMEQILNTHGILARGVIAEYKEVDVTEELDRDTASQRRAKTRSLMVESGEITPEMARAMAVRDGDYTEDIAQMAEEMPEEVEVDDDESNGGTDRRIFNLPFGRRPKRQATEQTNEEKEAVKQLKKVSQRT